MKLTNVIEAEYEDVSETVVDRLVPLKKDVKLLYEFMHEQRTYAKNVHALRKSYSRKKNEVPLQMWYETNVQRIIPSLTFKENSLAKIKKFWHKYNGQKIIRPLTFRENLQARVDDFETLKNDDGSTRTIKDRLRLFDDLLDSCTGVAYSYLSGDFMILPLSKELITLPKNFCDEFINVNYASLQGKGTALKRSQAKYNKPLTELEVISHPAWMAAMQEDISLLCTYASIVFNHLSDGKSKGMGFYLIAYVDRTQLRRLSVSRGYSDVLGYNNLGSGNSLLRGTPSRRL